jgi:predicted esterase
MKYSILLPKKDWKKCLMLLPGKGGDGRKLAKLYSKHEALDNIFIVGLTPRGYAWYPSPMNHKETQTLKGIDYSRKILKRTIKKIQRACSIDTEDTILAGFSSGGVLAIETAITSKTPYAGVIVHSGAFYSFMSFPPVRHKHMPFLLTHGEDDDVFGWSGYYLQMKKRLEGRYQCEYAERPDGGHYLMDTDLDAGVEFVKKHLNIVS